jgi:hypothetical protein
MVQVRTMLQLASKSINVLFVEGLRLSQRGKYLESFGGIETVPV